MAAQLLVCRIGRMVSVIWNSVITRCISVTNGYFLSVPPQNTASASVIMVMQIDNDITVLISYLQDNLLSGVNYRNKWHYGIITSCKPHLQFITYVTSELFFISRCRKWNSWKGLLESVFPGLFPPSGCMSLALLWFGYLSNRSTIVWGRSLTKTTQHGYVPVWEKSAMNDDNERSYREQTKHLIMWADWYRLNSPFQTGLCQIFYLVDPKTDFCVARWVGIYWTYSILLGQIT